MVDTDGRTLGLILHPADVQDRDGAVQLLKASRSRHPFVAKAPAGSIYSSDCVADATCIDVQIVRKIADQAGFAVHPHCFSKTLYKGRNAIERMFCRVKDCRRLATRYDRNANFLGAIHLAATVMWWL